MKIYRSNKKNVSKGREGRGGGGINLKYVWA